VDFYFSHEEILIKKFTEALKNHVKRDAFVLLLDTYEECMDLDIALREKLLEDFPRSVIFVFAGRNSIYDNCNLSWRENTHFFELHEFDQKETASFLQKKSIKNDVLTQAVFDFTRGVPLAVGLAVNAIEQVNDEQVAIALFRNIPMTSGATIERRRIIEEMAERFLSLVPPEELHLIHTQQRLISKTYFIALKKIFTFSNWFMTLWHPFVLLPNSMNTKKRSITTNRQCVAFNNYSQKRKKPGRW
jgi:hypothetical protein